MVIRHVTGQPALPHNQVAESEVKDPNRTSKRDRGIAVTGQLQSLTELKNGDPRHPGRPTRRKPVSARNARVFRVRYRARPLW